MPLVTRLEDDVDNHLDELLKAAFLSTILMSSWRKADQSTSAECGYEPDADTGRSETIANRSPRWRGRKWAHSGSLDLRSPSASNFEFD
jgi:hypothetical protein